MRGNVVDFTEEQLKDLTGTSSSRHGFIVPFALKAFMIPMEAHEKGLLFDAIFDYITTGEIPSNISKFPKSFPHVAFMQFREQYIKDAHKYLERVKKNRENGKKGGSVPRHNTTTGEILP